MLCEFLPKTMAEQVKWSVAFDAAKMEKGEEPMNYFGRVDKIVGVIASLGELKSVGDVNRKIIMTLASDYEMEELFYIVRASPERRLCSKTDVLRSSRIERPKREPGSILEWSYSWRSRV